MYKGFFVFGIIAPFERNKTVRKEGDFMCEILKKISKLSPNGLLRKYNIDTAQPVDLEKLLKGIGISAYSYDFTEVENAAQYEKGAIEGVAISQGDDLTILYSKNLNDYEARYTVAHELGHCCLHAEDLRINHIEFRKNPLTSVEKEKECGADEFAEMLLVPTDALTRICGLLIKPTVTILSDIFEVPMHVMKSRLSKFNYHKVFDDTSDIDECF